MLSFLYPAFLIGAIAAAIPVLLHLLRNEQAPELRFSAVRLLREVKVEHTQRRRIRDWLLLVLRASALLLLAVAFARPYFGGARVAGGEAAVIVLDRSASMGSGRAWHNAREAVLAEIARARSSEALALVAFDDRPDVIVAPTFDRGALRAAVGRVQPGIGGTRYQSAIARAVSVLDEADAARGRIVLVSDLQGTLADARITVPALVALDIQAIPGGAGNIAVLAAHRTGDGVVATVRNDSRSTRQIRLRLEADGRMMAEAPVDLPPLQPVDVRLHATVTRDHLRVTLVDPDPGGLTADDSRALQPDADARTRVLVVSAPEDSFYLDSALRAADDASAFDVVGASVAGLMASLAQQQLPDVVFLVGARGVDRAGRDALLRYVRNGGRLFVSAPDGLNEPGFVPLLDGLSVSLPRADDPVLTLAAVEARHPLFSRLGPVAGAMGAARFTRAWRVRASGWDVLARFNDGAPALLERGIGSGRVVFFASDVNRGWNDFPLQSAFVPFVHEIVRYLGPDRVSREFTPGTLPEGSQPALGFVTLSNGQVAAVNADPRESDGGRMTAAQFSSAVRHRGDRRLDAGAARRRAQAVEEQQSFWRYGLMLMFVTLVAEGLVSGLPRGIFARPASQAVSEKRV